MAPPRPGMVLTELEKFTVLELHACIIRALGTYESDFLTATICSFLQCTGVFKKDTEKAKHFEENLHKIVLARQKQEDEKRAKTTYSIFERIFAHADQKDFKSSFAKRLGTDSEVLAAYFSSEKEQLLLWEDDGDFDGLCSENGTAISQDEIYALRQVMIMVCREYLFRLEILRERALIDKIFDDERIQKFQNSWAANVGSANDDIKDFLENFRKSVITTDDIECDDQHGNQITKEEMKIVLQRYTEVVVNHSEYAI